MFLHRLSPRWRKRLLWLAAAFVVYSLAGFFLLPPLIRWQMEKRLPGLTHRQATVRQVKLNPWTLTLAVRGLSLTEPDGRRFAAWEEFRVNFQASSLFRWAWTFKEIRLAEPFGEVILLADGRLNLANLFEGSTNAPPKPAEPGGIPRVQVSLIEVTNGFVALEDRTRRSLFRTEYRPINLRLRDFTTRPHSDTPYAFHAESDTGRSVTWSGDLTVQPLRSAGHLEVTGVRLPRYQPYLEDFTRAVLTNGLADVQLDYRFAAGTNGLDLVVTNAALQVAEVELFDPASHEQVAGLRGLAVSQAGYNFRDSSIRLGTVKVSEATLLARLKPDGHLNLLELLTLPSPATHASPAPAAAGKGGPPLTVAMDDFAIERTAVRFEDLTRRTPFKTELKPIEVRVQGFTTQTDSDGRFSFHIASEAAETFEGTGTFSINPLRSAGEVKVGAVDLRKYLPYAEDFFRGHLLGGKLAVQVPYGVSLAAGNLDGRVTNLSLSLTDLEVQLPETPETVTQVRQLGFEGVDASVADRRGRVRRFHGDGGSILVRRHKDGSINLLGLLAVARTNAPPAAPAPNAGTSTNRSAVALGGWTLDLDELDLVNYTLRIEDQVPAQPAAFRLERLALNLRGAGTGSNRVVTTALAFDLNDTAHLAVRGTAMLEPPFAELEVGLTNLDLRAIQPYVEPVAALTVASGSLSAATKVRFQVRDPAAPRLTVAGDVHLTNLLTTDQVMFKEFARCEALAVRGIDASLAPNRVAIEELRLVRPKASLVMGADRRPNLALILRQEAATTNTSTAVAPAAPPAEPATNVVVETFPIQLGTLALDGASFVFTDESVQPQVTLGVEELSGTVKGLSSALDATAEVDLAGKVDPQSPFSISGRVNPFPASRRVDLTITNANTQLTPLTGYLEKYGGYPLRKGRLSTRLHYQLEGTALQAENKIQVDQFTLGPRNDSPDATKLPLKLGVALLKDNNGLIELDVPVQGRLDDPEFSLGPIVLKVVVNLIVKAATSPFKLLGALVGGGGDELSYVAFVPGTTNLVEGELDKLGKLSAALTKRPALSLEIEGAIDPRLDRDALARQRLADQLKARRLQELTAKGRAPEAVAAFQIEPEERDRLLRAAFVEQFGTNVAAVIQTNLARLTSTNQPASTNVAAAPVKPPRSFLQRLTAPFGGGSSQSTPAEKRLSKADREVLGLATPELMETLLAEQIPVTEGEFGQLMAARARCVQDWIVQHGQIAADRVFLVTPKPPDAAYQGESRVVLSLN